MEGATAKGPLATDVTLPKPRPIASPLPRPPLPLMLFAALAAMAAFFSSIPANLAFSSSSSFCLSDTSRRIARGLNLLRGAAAPAAAPRAGVPERPALPANVSSRSTGGRVAAGAGESAGV